MGLWVTVACIVLIAVIGPLGSTALATPKPSPRPTPASTSAAPTRAANSEAPADDDDEPSTSESVNRWLREAHARVQFVEGRHGGSHPPSGIGSGAKPAGGAPNPSVPRKVKDVKCPLTRGECEIQWGT
jgi:hypothetical protein